MNIVTGSSQTDDETEWSKNEGVGIRINIKLEPGMTVRSVLQKLDVIIQVEAYQ